MISVVILLDVEKPKVNAVAEILAGYEGVEEVYSVAGRYDLVVLVKVESHEKIADLVTDKMLKTDGIVKSETLISFRVYSKEDKEGMFSIGME